MDVMVFYFLFNMLETGKGQDSWREKDCNLYFWWCCRAVSWSCYQVKSLCCAMFPF